MEYGVEQAFPSHEEEGEGTAWKGVAEVKEGGIKEGC